MTQSKTVSIRGLRPKEAGAAAEIPSLVDIIKLLEINTEHAGRLIDSLPFSANDTTAGSECELQTVVLGVNSDVDLPITIEQSNYYMNIIRRAAAGETPKRVITDLEKYLKSNSENVWENSWVRFPMHVLSPFAREVLDFDLLADKKNPGIGARSDTDNFIYHEHGEEYLRIPISYLIKLSLADVLGTQRGAPKAISGIGHRVMNHFLNDNTSPETFSFHVVPLRPDAGMGRGIARETSKRFLLTQLLTMYANDKFWLRESGQEVRIYFAPHPPTRQKQLNECISDAFYRDLFMSPCLSGWDKGEAKHTYMNLCHKVLSRSQLNTVAKLREAGIITSNLVVLPNISNISLANNGTHISLGSIKLSQLLADKSSGFSRIHEKYLGDLVIKIVEHFLPLFVGSYSAAPYRLDFSDFHPERALGFLPHELDYTHLRMIWRRWKKKANLKILGHPITPFGPELFDRLISGVFNLKGDFVPDYRLIDYFAALMSTDRSPLLDGTLGNGDRLKKDLADMGIFDTKMALYLLYRLREFHSMGFSGFEGRYYSQFHSLRDDMGRAADLQTLLTALAFKYIAEGKVTHAHIPDDPSTESERRHIFFGTSIGIPTFFVRKDTGNTFLKRIVAAAKKVRSSHRYPGYLRVCNVEYRKALVRIIEEDAADLIEMLNLKWTMEDLKSRLHHPEEHSAFGKLTRGMLEEMSIASPLKLPAEEFNKGAERYYRGTLRKEHTREAFLFLEEDIRRMNKMSSRESYNTFNEELHFALDGCNASEFLSKAREAVLEERASPAELRKLINLVLLTIHHDAEAAEAILNDTRRQIEYGTPIHRAAQW